jgi:uncharacterized protein YkuJ
VQVVAVVDKGHRASPLVLEAVAGVARKVLVCLAVLKQAEKERKGEREKERQRNFERKGSTTVRLKANERGKAFQGQTQSEKEQHEKRGRHSQTETPPLPE